MPKRVCELNLSPSEEWFSWCEKITPRQVQNMRDRKFFSESKSLNFLKEVLVKVDTSSVGYVDELTKEIMSMVESFSKRRCYVDETGLKSFINFLTEELTKESNSAVEQALHYAVICEDNYKAV
ncbi:MAG: hypothetical protein GY928_17055 [Colwellia sp.]|nr:hypothetical protein [Colwellia sp.]